MHQKRADNRGTVEVSYLGGLFEDGEKEKITSMIMMGTRMDSEQRVVFRK